MSGLGLGRHRGQVARGVDGARSHGGDALAEHLIGFGMLGQGDGGDAGAEDSGFFGGDGGDGVAEKLLVIEIDIGDDGEDGLDDVGGVEASAHADFEDGDFDAGGGKEIEGDGGHGLKKAGQVRQLGGGDERGGDLGDALVGGGEVRVRNGLAAADDALIDAQQMRRSVEAGAVRRGMQDGGESGRRGAFAVGSGDEHGGKVALRVAERLAESAHVRQIELARGMQLVAEGVQRFDRGLVGDHVAPIIAPVLLSHRSRKRASQPGTRQPMPLRPRALGFAAGYAATDAAPAAGARLRSRVRGNRCRSGRGRSASQPGTRQPMPLRPRALGFAAGYAATDAAPAAGARLRSRVRGNRCRSGRGRSASQPGTRQPMPLRPRALG